MGELTTSIAHEVNQPLAGIVTNASACLRWLAGDAPNLEEARAAAQRIIRDGNRASEVVARVRALATKADTEKQPLDLNDAVQEVLALTQTEVLRNAVLLRRELAGDLPHVLGDRVQLQQVVLNLVMNGIEAMSTVRDRPRVLTISTQRDEGDQVRVTVQDSGVGLDSKSEENIFKAFYTTKRGGMGMGLSISRTIVENHGGRLSTVRGNGPGATFQFTVPQHA
jgi:signal transduction histidine kinase